MTREADDRYCRDIGYALEGGVPAEVMAVWRLSAHCNCRITASGSAGTRPPSGSGASAVCAAGRHRGTGWMTHSAGDRSTTTWKLRPKRIIANSTRHEP